MELATRHRPTYRRQVLTPEGWRVLGIRSASRYQVRNARLVARTVYFAPQYGHPLFGVKAIIVHG